MNNSIVSIKKQLETREQQEDFANQIILAITEGDINPLEIELFLKALSNVIARVSKNPIVKDCVWEELNKHPEKSFDYNGATFTKSSRKTWDYSNDEIWNELKIRIKAREAFLKAIPGDVADANTGELLKPTPYKTSDIISIIF